MYNQTNITKDKAYIIHQRPYQDSHAIIELFSHQYGRISCIRRGVRSSQKRKQFIFQAFVELELTVKTQKNKVKVDKITPLTGLADLPIKHLRLGLYLNELIYRLTQPFDSHSNLYEHYKQTIKQLNTQKPVKLLRQFELNLFSEIGYALPFDQLTQSEFHSYNPEKGFIARDYASAHAFSTASLIALANHNFELYAKENKIFIRYIIQQLLNGDTLKSYQLYT